jgi:hypothetical protein
MTPRAEKYLERARCCDEMANHAQATDIAALPRDLAIQWRALAFRIKDEFSSRALQRERPPSA